MKIQRNADHENTLPFGPCAGPTVDNGGSFFCQGSGWEAIDPFRMGDVSTAFSTAILCTPCESHREAQIIAANLERVMAA